LGYRHRIDVIWLAMALPALLAFLSGCAPGNKALAPGQVLSRQDPQYRREYVLYMPSYYRDDRRWPLLITCHGSGPFDTDKGQIADWKGLAERNGFLLAAPDLTIRRRLGSDNQAEYQQLAESVPAILSILRSLRGACSIDDERVFVAGFSTGSLPALLAALRYPDVFRAVSVRQPDFPPELLSSCVPFLDPYQPIQVRYSPGDLLTGKRATTCVDWLRGHDLNVAVIAQPGSGRDASTVFGFYAEVIRKQPWIRIHVRDNPTDDMQVSFSPQVSFKPARVRWEFGDGGSSPEPTPSHQYAKPGQYTVRLTVWSSASQHHVRQVQLMIPRVRLGIRTSAPSL
jgi:pimeloyl-ACP methyl ester carboxylesterase